MRLQSYLTYGRIVPCMLIARSHGTAVNKWKAPKGAISSKVKFILLTLMFQVSFSTKIDEYIFRSSKCYEKFNFCALIYGNTPLGAYDVIPTWYVGSIDDRTPAILTKSDTVAEIGKLPITDLASLDSASSSAHDVCLSKWFT